MSVEEEIAEQMSEETEGDQTPEPEPEPDEEGEAEQGETPEPNAEPDSEAMLEQRAKSFERLTQHTARRTSEILGDDATLVVECPFCSYYGMPGFIPAIRHGDEVAANVAHAFGTHAPTELREDDYSQECPKCAGFGVVRTGSKAPGRDTLPCYDCQGDGWIAVGEERNKNRVLGSNGAQLAVVPTPITGYTGVEPAGDDPPEVAALKGLGYTVIPPFVPQPS